MALTDLEKAQFALALRCGFAKDHPVIETLWPSAEDLSEMMQDGLPALEKDILFSTIALTGDTETPERTNFFAYAEFLEQLPKLLSDLQESGATFTADDFTKSLAGGKSAVQNAADNKKVESVLDPEFWKGQMKEAEAVYHALSTMEQKAFDISEFRRAVAKASGEKLREDVLEEAGIKLDDIKTACKTGKLGEITAKMAKAGLHLEKEDLFLARVWEPKETWTHYDQIHEELSKIGDPISFDDLKRHIPSGSTTLQKTVLEHGLESECFKPAVKPEYWVGRSDQLHRLLGTENIPKEKQTKNKIVPGTILSELADLEYGPRFNNLDLSDIDLDFVITPIKPPVTLKDQFGKQAGTDVKEITPLGVPSFWAHIEEIYEHLKDRGTPLKPEHLLEIVGYNGETGIHAAARAGAFRVVMDIYRDAGMVMTNPVLVRDNHSFEDAFDLMLDQDVKQIIFDPQYWVGKATEIKELHDELNTSLKGKVPIDDIVKQLNRAGVIREASQIEFDPFSSGVDGPN